MLARIKEECKLQAVFCGSPEPYTHEWQEVPAKNEEQVLGHPYLEIGEPVEEEQEQVEEEKPVLPPPPPNTSKPQGRKRHG